MAPAKRDGGSRVTLRLPDDCIDYVARQAAGNWTSLNAEVIKAIRALMQAEEKRRA
jgi:hypothetical protein